jgi:hypothetical protein
MPKKRQRARTVDLIAVANLRDELVAFANEFDISDSVQMEVELDRHISNLITAGLITVNKKQDAPHLEDVLAYILKIPPDGELMENARQFRTLISRYGGEPTDEDMEEACEILANMIDTLNATEGIREAHGQTRINFE